ncbi:MAG: O-antigen ligase family protein [Actinomycetes bacterium]
MPSLMVLAALPLIVALTIFGFRRPVDLLLPAYAATVPFGKLLSTGVAPPFDSMSSLLALVLLAALSAKALYGRSAQSRFPATAPIWLLFLGLTGASAVWSVSPQITLEAFRNLGILVALYVLVALTPFTLPELRRLESAIVLGGVAAASYGIFQFVTGTLPVDLEGGGGGRFGRDLLGANNTAAALLLPLAIALCRSVAAPSSRTRLAHTVATGVVVFGILLTGSRGGLLATAACLGITIVFIPRGRRVLLRYAAAVVVVVAVVLVLQPGGIAGRTDSTKSSGRTDIWKVGLYACQIYCLQGSGWGTFPRVYQLEQAYVGDARTLGRGVAYEPHNIWILIGIEAGLAGLVLALLGLLLTVRDSLRLPPSLRAPPLAANVATLVAAFFLSNFEYKFFWLTLTYTLVCRSVAITASRSAVVRVVPLPDRPDGPKVGAGAE